MKRLQGKRIAVMLLVLGLLLTACAAQAQELRVDFYDMGKADAMLITTPSGVRILIDTGTNKGGKALVERFEKEGINAIDTVPDIFNKCIFEIINKGLAEDGLFRKPPDQYQLEELMKKLND